MGLILKYGAPIMKVSLESSGVSAARGDGVILSVPGPAAVAVHPGLVANLTAIAASGAPVVIVGRCDVIPRELHALAGVACGGGGVTGGLAPAYYGPASFVVAGYPATANISLGPRARATAVDARTRVLGSLADGAAFFTRRGNVTWAQLNDFTLPVRADLTLKNYGAAAAHYDLARELRARSFPFLDGIAPTRPLTLHTWQAGAGTRYLLAGNLEGNNCRSPCAVPSDLGPREVVVGVAVGSSTAADAAGGGGLWSVSGLTSAEPSVLRSCGALFCAAGGPLGPFAWHRLPVSRCTPAPPRLWGR